MTALPLHNKLLHPKPRQLGTPEQEIGPEWLAHFHKQALQRQQFERDRKGDNNWNWQTTAWHRFASIWPGVPCVRVVLTRSTTHTTDWKVAGVYLDEGEHEKSGWRRY